MSITVTVQAALRILKTVVQAQQPRLIYQVLRYINLIIYITGKATPIELIESWGKHKQRREDTTHDLIKSAIRQYVIKQV